MFFHTFHPRPLILEFGWLKLHWYGLIIALAAVFALFLILKFNKKYQEKNIIIFKDKEQVFDLFFYLVIFGLIGSRIYEVFLFFPYYLNNPLDIFKIWNGGLAIHGGILAGILVIILFARKHKINLGLIFDVVAPALAFGQAVGRWGNYFNQELVGLPTELPWGIPIDLINRPVGYEQFVFFHPTFLYESLLSLILAGVLIGLHYWRLKVKELSSFSYGNIFLVYLAGYSIIRFFLEFVKIDETVIFFGWRWPQVISVILLAIAIGIFVYKKRLKQG
jgi:phosphatidylglycerol:prolipoprotein diacylglycerol transferase